MHNPVYNLIFTYLAQFKAKFTVIQKKSKNGKSFFLVKPKEVVTPLALKIDAIKYILKDWHISIYEDLLADEGNGETSYHVTMNFYSDENNFFTARLYFNHHNDLLYINFKDSNNDPLGIKGIREIILQVTKAYTADFHTVLWNVYSTMHEDFASQHEKQVKALYEKKQLSDVKVLGDYSKNLDEILHLLEKWDTYELQKNPINTGYFKQLKSSVASRMEAINAEQVDETYVKEENLTSVIYIEPNIEKPIKDVTRLLQIQEVDVSLCKLNEDTAITPLNKLTQEYSLLNKKFKLIEGGEKALSCVLRIREVEDLALKSFIALVINDAEYNRVNPTDLVALLKVVPYIKLSHYYLVIYKNRCEALKTLLQTHNYVNLDMPINAEGLTLLVYAYDQKLFGVFQILLEAGVACNKFLDKDCNTLLMRACRDGRAAEIKALLKAGAANTCSSVNEQYLNPFGILTFNYKKKPDLTLVALFINHCQLFDIDFMQGHLRLRGTPLLFACQHGWSEAVEYYLQQGANPMISRETDLLNALDVSAAKDNVMLCEILLTKSKYSMDELCDRALKIAQHFKSDKAAEFLTNYMNLNKITTNSNIPITAFFSKGATAEMLKYKKSPTFIKEQECLRDFAISLQKKSESVANNNSLEQSEKLTSEKSEESTTAIIIGFNKG